MPGFLIPRGGFDYSQSSRTLWFPSSLKPTLMVASLISRWTGLLLIGLFWLPAAPAAGQALDCPYPILFAHGYTGSQFSWDDFYADPRVAALWGSTDVFHAVINATTNTHIWGADQTPHTADDDVLVQFINESNTLAPGCLYAYNWENYWNEDPNAPELIVQGGGSPSFFDSDSNEAAPYKQGYALGQMIARVLAANPDKPKVILMGHSMGGLTGREYLQRRTNGTPAWWVAPALPDGHKVAKLVTVATPHRGSNFFGNPWPAQDPDDQRRDGLPDLASEATRDLRYSYTCFLFFSCRAPYLWGGNEADDIPNGFWNDDVNANGSETDDITGLNVDGTTTGGTDPWDGTFDNPAMPLPTTVRYTWITANTTGTGDQIVDLNRQWLFDGTTPRPLDPANTTAYLLADTLLMDDWHLSQTDEVPDLIRALDEGDYPAYAWHIQPETAYAGLAQIRSQSAPDGPATTDVDWFVFDHTGGPLFVHLVPTPGLSGRVDFYTAPPPYTTANGAASALFSPGPAPVVLPAGPQPAGTYHVRVTHADVGSADWETPYALRIAGPALAAVRLMLHGPFQGGTLHPTLNALGLLPNTQPYAAPLFDGTPMDYDGPESVPPGFFAAHPEVVDWALMELRATATGPALARRAVLVTQTGHVVDLDGTAPVAFSTAVSAAYFVVLRHRNHHALMSAGALDLTPSATLYDFTTAQTQAYGTNPMRALDGTTYGAYGGDGNADTQTTAFDLLQVWLAENGTSGYSQGDFNLNGDVTAFDMLMVWLSANGQSSQVP